MAFKIAGNDIIDNNRGLKSYSDTVVTLGNTGTATTIDLANGNSFTASLTGNCVFTFSNPPTGFCSFTLILTNDGTASRTITWPGSVKWPNGSIPPRTTTANRTDVYTFFTVDGGTIWYGNLSLYNFS
jgi:hypothetical protein